MRTTTIALIITMICISNAFADIAPNPIKAKGIMASGKSTIRMVSERVIVDLYKDSSVVECHFFMKNEGGKQPINIGFPEMNFHHFKPTNASDFSKSFVVEENGKQVRTIDRYLPNMDLRTKRDKSLAEYDMKYEEQPWYLWGSVFDKGETKTIKVRYSLPFGQIKSGSRYFTYLLNTGSGWKGSIDSAEIVVNIKDFSTDLVWKTMPENHLVKDNQIKWVFTNLEPTINDDIKIYYEPYKGYMENIRKPMTEPTFVLNDEIVPSLDNLSPKETLTIKILKDVEETKKYTSAQGGVIIIYTKDYAIDKLKEIIASKSSRKHSLSYDSSADFLGKYKLVMDDITYAGNDVLIKSLDLKNEVILNVEIKRESKGKRCIQIIK